MGASHIVAAPVPLFGSQGQLTRRPDMRLKAFGLFLVAAPLEAQQLRGTVTDSASRLSIPGAVVTTLDSAGGIGRRSVTDERGTYVVTTPPATRRLRIVRLGFRPNGRPPASVVTGATAAAPPRSEIGVRAVRSGSEL